MVQQKSKGNEAVPRKKGRGMSEQDKQILSWLISTASEPSASEHCCSQSITTLDVLLVFDYFLSSEKTTGNFLNLSFLLTHTWCHRCFDTDLGAYRNHRNMTKRQQRRHFMTAKKNFKTAKAEYHHGILNLEFRHIRMWILISRPLPKVEVTSKSTIWCVLG